jgi:hypothetical protein
MERGMTVAVVATAALCVGVGVLFLSVGSKAGNPPTAPTAAPVTLHRPSLWEAYSRCMSGGEFDYPRAWLTSHCRRVAMQEAGR